jgi:DHA1 family bicyclomycin/chloramphenicol resistance-like MFS transporter
MTQTTPSRFLDRSTPPHLLTLVLLASVSAMNMSIFLPSLPAMTQEFGTSYSIMQLSVTAYLACTAVIQIIIGPISDRFGRRPVILASMVVFVAASIGCAMATSIEVFLAFRMIQSAVAVAMVLSRAIVRDMVGQEEAASMIAFVTMGMSLVPMFAPTLGGVLQEAFGWRATFWFICAFGVALGALCWFDQGETNRSGGMSFRAPYVATQVYGQPPTVTGFLFGIPAVGYFLGNFASGKLAVRVGINRMVLIGTMILVIGMSLSLIVSFAGYGSAFSFFAFCTFVGAGNGLVLPNATAGLLSVRPHLAGTASGVGSAIMIGGGAGLATIAGLLLERGNSAYPLQWIMLLSVVCALISILYVMRREKSLPR